MNLTMPAESAASAVEQALGQIDSAGGEMVLDFSAVRRIDARALGALEKLAGAAKEKAVKVALRGVNIGMYKALKLAKMAPRFSFPA